MRTPVLVGAGILAILLAAFVLEHQLSAPIEVPAAPPQVARVEPARLPLPAPAPLPGAPAPRVEPPSPGPSLIPLPPVAVVQADRGAGVDEEAAFTADNAREIEYAFQMVAGPRATVATAKNAAEVFERCLKQFPHNARCYQGLVEAQQRIQNPEWKSPGRPVDLAQGMIPGEPLKRLQPGSGEPKFKLRTLPPNRQP